jgi:hypothetical protein
LVPSSVGSAESGRAPAQPAFAAAGGARRVDIRGAAVRIGYEDEGVSQGVVQAAEYYRDTLGFRIAGYRVTPPQFAIVWRDEVEQREYDSLEKHRTTTPFVRRRAKRSWRNR